jgi:Domain of unknown function (DUF4126)
MPALLSILTGLGLSTAAGLNAYLPLLIVGLFARLGWMPLEGPFMVLAHPLVLLIIAALAVVDFIGDKVPAIDSMLHTAGLVIAPLAGVVLFLSQSGAAELDPLVAGIAGLIVAGSTHAARAAVRPAVTAATVGTGNPVVSFVEDLLAVALAVLAVLVPGLAIALIAVLIVIAVRFFRRAVGVWGGRAR